MARACDAGICVKAAICVGTYTSDRKEQETKAACSHEHAAELSRDMVIRGYVLNWKDMPGADPKVTP